MENKILNRIEEISGQLESLMIKHRELISNIHATELEIKELSAVMGELKKILE